MVERERDKDPLGLDYLVTHDKRWDASEAGMAYAARYLAHQFLELPEDRFVRALIFNHLHGRKNRFDHPGRELALPLIYDWTKTLASFGQEKTSFYKLHPLRLARVPSVVLTEKGEYPVITDPIILAEIDRREEVRGKRTEEGKEVMLPENGLTVCLTTDKIHKALSEQVFERYGLTIKQPSIYIIESYTIASLEYEILDFGMYTIYLACEGEDDKAHLFRLKEICQTHQHPFFIDGPKRIEVDESSLKPGIKIPKTREGMIRASDEGIATIIALSWQAIKDKPVTLQELYETKGLEQHNLPAADKPIIQQRSAWIRPKSDPSRTILKSPWDHP